jgi:predicted HTH domain antitoxin
MASVTIEIPNDLWGKLKNDSGEPDATLRRVAAFFLCSRGELSTSQAARLAGMTYGEFLEAAARAKVMLFPVDVEELKEEATRGYTLGRQRFTDHSAGQGGAS